MNVKGVGHSRPQGMTPWKRQMLLLKIRFWKKSGALAAAFLKNTGFDTGQGGGVPARTGIQKFLIPPLMFLLRPFLWGGSNWRRQPSACPFRCC